MIKYINLGVISFVQIFGQFIIQILLIRTFGIGEVTDTYLQIQVIFNIIASIIIISLQNLWMPNLASKIEDNSKFRLEVANGLGFSLILSICIVPLIIFLILCSNFILYKNISHNQNLIISCSIIFGMMSIINIYSSILVVAKKIEHKYYFAEFISAAFNFALIVVIYFSKIDNIYLFMSAVLIKTIIITIFMMHYSRWPVPNFKIDKDNLKLYWNNIRYLLTFGSVIKSMPIFDRYIVSLEGVGELTLLNIIYSIINSIVLIIEKIICTPLMTRYSLSYAKSDFIGIKNEYRKAILKISISFVILVLMFFVIDKYIEEILGYIYKLDKIKAAVIVKYCEIMLVHVYFSLLGIALVAVFYAINDTVSPIKIGLAGFIVGLFLKIVVYNYYGLNGFFIVSSLYLLINVVLYYILIEVKINNQISSGLKNVS